MVDAKALVADDLAAVSEARDFLGVGRATIYRIIEAGSLPYVKNRLGAANPTPKPHPPCGDAPVSPRRNGLT
jgi:excisionase family DNA binding protein